jgi:hypothetical protein
MLAKYRIENKVKETQIASSVTKNASFCCCLSIESYTEILIGKRLKPSAKDCANGNILVFSW